MSWERRGYDRENLVRADIPGVFTIEIDGIAYPFQKVNDVSISGMGLTMDKPVASGMQVVVRYESSDFRVALQGAVAWCTPDGAEHKIGIQFATDDLDSNVMFFMTLREYIDDFGEAF